MSSATRTYTNGVDCRVRPLTERIAEARWKMFGHVLRSGESTPAYLSFSFFIIFCLTCKEGYKGRRGAHRTNLFDVLIKDLIKRNLISNKVLKLTVFDDLDSGSHGP